MAAKAAQAPAVVPPVAVQPPAPAGTPPPPPPPPPPHKLIRHVCIGDGFSGVYYVEAAFVRKTVTNKDFLDLTLRDKSGSQPVKHWGTNDAVKRGEFVFIEARAEDYQGRLSIVAKDVDRVDAPTDLSDYIATVETISEDAAEFDRLREQIEADGKAESDETCKAVLDDLFGMSALLHRYLESPDGTGPVYGRKGGLLLRSVRICHLAQQAAPFFGLTKRQTCLAMTGALLYRLGAIEAYEFQDCVPVETARGLLQGVDALGMVRLSVAVRRLGGGKDKPEGWNPDTAQRLIHAVTASSGKLVKPMTPEAILLANVRQMDAEITAASDFITNDQNTGEAFTAFDPAMGRRYLR